MIDKSKPRDISKIILEVIDKKKPQSTRHLVELLWKNIDLSKEEIVESILKLQDEGLIRLEKNVAQSQPISTYLRTNEVVWYWITVAIGITTSILVFLIPENAFPWIYARNALGLLFVLFLPGYSLVKVLSQNKTPHKESIRNLETIERIALSVGMSFALVSIIGLLLYHSPWGLDLTSAVFSLLAFTLIFSTVALIRDYKTQKQISS